MAKNISLLGANYPDVPAVVLPQTGGGSASFTDVSDTTATENDVESGKVFYKATGERAVGNHTDEIFKVITYSCTKSFAGWDAFSITGDDLGVSTPSGYTPLAVRGYESSSGRIVPYLINIGATGTSAVMSMKNFTEGSATAVIQISIVYVLSSSIGN